MPPAEPQSQFQLRVKSWTAVLTAAAVVSCLLYDWDKAAGQKTVFGGIRPAVKSVFNRVYGVTDPSGRDRAA
jgi:hypothetical protein